MTKYPLTSSATFLRHCLVLILVVLQAIMPAVAHAAADRAVDDTPAATDAFESLFIIENETLFYVNPSDGSYVNRGNNWPNAPIAMTALGDHLYIIENQALYRIDPNNGTYTNPDEFGIHDYAVLRVEDACPATIPAFHLAARA